MPDWIAVRTPLESGVITSRAPFDPQTTDALVRAARKVRRDPGGSRPGAQKSVYVVLLRFATGDYGLYVGSTGHRPEERYLKHKAGYKDSRWVRRFGVGLLPTLYRHLNPQGGAAALRAEVALAEALRSTGLRVEQA